MSWVIKDVYFIMFRVYVTHKPNFKSDSSEIGSQRLTAERAIPSPEQARAARSGSPGVVLPLVISNSANH